MADWAQFSLAFIASCILIVLPGYLFFIGLRFSRPSSIGFAPLFTIFFYGIWTVILRAAGIQCNWAIAAVPLFVICLIPFALRIKKRKGKHVESVDTLFGFYEGKISLAFLGVGIAYAIFVYCLSIGTPTSFVQGFDNAHHLGLVTSMLESGNWSTIDTTLFPDYSEGGYYYPAIWSILVVLVANATHCPVTIAANALNVLLLAVVFSFGIFLFVSSSLKKRSSVLCCALIFLTFSAIPWMQLRYGPLYPNFAGFVLLPAFYAAFIELSLRDGDKRQKLAALACVLLGGISIAMCHPSALFTAVVFCIPVCIFAIWKITSEKECSFPIKAITIGAFVILCLVLWKVVHDLPFMHSVVTMEYDKQSNIFESIKNTLLLAYPHFTHEIPLAILVAIGFVLAIKEKEQRFLATCYALICIIYIANMSMDYGPMKSLISGFWYNHSTRLAASSAIIAIPLAGLGLSSLANIIANAFESRRQKDDQGSKRNKKARTLIVLVIAAIVVSPVGIWTNGIGATSMGQVWSRLHSMSVENSGRVVFKQDEQDFAKKITEIVGDESYIANIPYDGSGFSYALYETNVLYRSFSYSKDDENALICQHLSEVASNDELKDLLLEMNVHYVMILDREGAEGSSFYSNTYKPQYWSGINAIQDDTPGFEVVLSDNDMRLYRITALD